MFFVLFFFLIYNITIIILCLPLQFSYKHILEFNYFQGEEGQFFHYYQMLLMQIADCRLHTGGVGLSFLDRLIFLHS